MDIRDATQFELQDPPDMLDDNVIKATDQGRVSYQCRDVFRTQVEDINNN